MSTTSEDSKNRLTMILATVMVLALVWRLWQLTDENKTLRAQAATMPAMKGSK